jgi:hypothetical protein
MGKLQVSKLDAAKRQLEVAVRLFFFEGEPVSLHTLVGAAYNLLRDINRHLDGEPLFVKETLVEHVRPQMKEEFLWMVNEAENFFKHADRDPDRTLLFHTGQTETLLWDACQAYRRLTSEASPTLLSYEWWVHLTQPEIFEVPSDTQAVLETLRSAVADLSKREFYFAAYEAAVRNSQP